MQNQTMPKAKSVGPISVLGLCSPLLLLAEVEAEGKEKKARLRAQQRGRVATRKKGRLRRFLMRHLFGSEGPKVRCPTCGSRYRVQVYRAAPTRRPERKGELGGAVPKMSPTQEESGKQAVQPDKHNRLVARVKPNRIPDGEGKEGDGFLWP